jgi:hypothetical protein
MLISYHNQAHNTWDEHLADVQQALNSAFHASIGSSPAEIFLGRNLTQPIELHWEIEDDTAKPDLRARWAAALKTVLKTQRETATRYNKGRQQCTLKVGDNVLCKKITISDASTATTSKLAYAWSEPYQILRFLTPVTVLLGELNSDIPVRKAHLSQVKIFHQTQDGPQR